MASSTPTRATECALCLAPLRNEDVQQPAWCHVHPACNHCAEHIYSCYRQQCPLCSQKEDADYDPADYDPADYDTTLYYQPGDDEDEDSDEAVFRWHAFEAPAFLRTLMRGQVDDEDDN